MGTKQLGMNSYIIIDSQKTAESSMKRCKKQRNYFIKLQTATSMFKVANECFFTRAKRRKKKRNKSKEKVGKDRIRMILIKI